MLNIFMPCSSPKICEMNIILNKIFKPYYLPYQKQFPNLSNEECSIFDPDIPLWRYTSDILAYVQNDMAKEFFAALFVER